MYKVKGIMYMIHSVALIIADFLFSKDAITEEEKEVCAYGMELIISGIIIIPLDIGYDKIVHLSMTIYVKYRSQ